MAEVDSDDETFERVDSAPTIHNEVPKNTKYRIIVINEDKPKERIEYDLSAGRILPYITELKGKWKTKRIIDLIWLKIFLNGSIYQ